MGQARAIGSGPGARSSQRALQGNKAGVRAGRFAVELRGELKHARKGEARCGVSDRVILGSEPDRIKSEMKTRSELQEKTKDAEDSGRVGSMILKSVVDGHVVDVEYDVPASPVFAPTEDCLENRIHLLHLNVLWSHAAGAASREPAGVVITAEALGAAGVSMNGEGLSIGLDKIDAVPPSDVGVPPT